MAYPKFKEWKKEDLDLAIQRLHELTLQFEKIGYPLLLGGGNLLGIVRNNDLILPNDNDFDTYVILKSNNKQDAKQEITKINNFFRINNQFCEDNNFIGQSHICSKYGNEFKFDVWFMWFEENRVFLFPVIYDDLDKKYFLPYKKIILRGYEWNIPNTPDKILEHLYNDWKVEEQRKPKSYVKYFFNYERN